MNLKDFVLDVMDKITGDSKWYAEVESIRSYYKIGSEIKDRHGNEFTVIGIDDNNSHGNGCGRQPYPVIRYKTGYEKKLSYRDTVEIMELNK